MINNIKINNLNGALGEAKAIAYMIEQGFHIFTQFDGHAPFDFIAYKETTHECLRISVKATGTKTSNAWKVTIKQDGKPFDPTACDRVLVYLTDVDEIREFRADAITNSHTLSIPFNTAFKARKRSSTSI